MVTNIKEAIELAKVYGVNPSEHPSAIVTSTGNVYLDDNIDPKDKGERFSLIDEVIEDENLESKKSKKKK